MNEQDETLERVVEIAHDLFLDMGYRGTTIWEICNRADISQSEFSELVGTKRELLLKVLRTEFERRSRDIDEYIESNDSITLPELIDHLSARYSINYSKGSLIGNLIGQSSPQDDEILQIIADGINTITNKIQIGLGKAMTGGDESELRKYAFYLIASIEGISLISKAKKDMWVSKSCLEILSKTPLAP